MPRVCTRCDVPISEENTRPSSFNNSRYMCRPCDNADRRKQRRSGPQRLKRWVHKVKQKGRQRGLEATMVLEDVMPLPETCPVFGMKLIYPGDRYDYRGPDNASIDRIDNDQGYVKGNVWVVSYRANTLKNNASISELKRLVRALELRRMMS